MRRHRALPAALLLPLALLAGCSGGTSKTSATPSASASSSPSSSPSTSGSPSPSTSPTSPSGSPTASDSPTDVPSNQAPLTRSQVAAVNLHKAILGANAASTPEQQAVVNAWMGFWQGVADTYYNYVPTAEFKKYSQDPARSQVLGHMADQRQKKERIVGWAQDNVQAVKVDQTTATITDCTRNFTFSVNEEGDRVSSIDAFYLVTGTLKQSGGQWVVAKQDSKILKKSCLS